MRDMITENRECGVKFIDLLYRPIGMEHTSDRNDDDIAVELFTSVWRLTNK